MIDVAEVERPAQQTSKTEDVQSSDRTQGPEARWSDKTGKVNLYSENVVKEADSTDEVDRESIANLATTRRQWESIFSTEPKEDSTSKPKKNPPKWQVRMPYAEKTAAGPATVTATTVSADSESPPSTPSSSMADTESAIEREIRLALEREEMLKREQEERVRQASLQPQRTYQVSSMESSTESELQPTFHELAEADRGSEFFINDQAVQREDAEREESLQKGFSQQKLHNASRADDNATESIIEREIRLQREREAELAQQRGGFSSPSTVVAAEPAVQRQRSPSPPLVEEEADLVVEEIPYEEAISQFNHEGESRIARELRELREREEEVRQLRERMTKVGAGEASQQKDTAAPPASKQPAKPVSAPQTPRGGDRSVPSTPRGGDKSTPTTPRVTMNFSRSVHASPRLDTSTPPESTSAAAPKPETPIEREIRLARERENELRRAKGLPELQPVPKKQESFDEPASEEFVGTPRYTPAQPDTTMRRFASNRLQQEIQDQRNREMTLRQEGKIISTSEEHIQPHKYTEVVGQDKVDGGTVKRNFRMPTRHSSNASQEDSGSAESTPRPQATVSTPRDGKPGKKGAGAGSLSFSYREFAQTAESKIERELREMREREEELRKQRSGGGES